MRLFILIWWLLYLSLHYFKFNDISQDTLVICFSILWATLYIADVLLRR